MASFLLCFCSLGDSFEDDEGIIVYTDGCCFHNGKHGASAGIGVYWGLDSKE